MEQGSNSISLKDTNQWALVSFVLIGFILGFGTNEIVNNSPAAPGAAPSLAAKLPSAPTPTAAPGPSAVPVANAADADDDFFWGKKDAPVTLIEFTDYQCPFCGRHKTQTFDQIKKEYIDTGKVKYVVRDYPLSFHQNAQKAAEASECAREQGKFEEMHGKLFSNQQSLDPASLKRFAGEAGVNQKKFDDCLDSGKFEAEVQKDFADGSASGITGTPGFLINGKKLSGAQPFASFKAVIDAEL